MVIGLLTIPLSSFGAAITYTSDVFSASALGGSGVIVSVPQFNPALGNLINTIGLQVSSIVTSVTTVKGTIIFNTQCMTSDSYLKYKFSSSQPSVIPVYQSPIIFIPFGEGVCDRITVMTTVTSYIEPFHVFPNNPAFIGTGSISIPFDLVYTIDQRGPWSQQGIQSLDWTGTLAITYEYKAAPTPEGSSRSLTLFGLGILFATIRGRVENRKVGL